MMKPHVGLAFSYQKHATGDVCHTGEEAKNNTKPRSEAHEYRVSNANCERSMLGTVILVLKRWVSMG